MAEAVGDSSKFNGNGWSWDLTRLFRSLNLLFAFSFFPTKDVSTLGTGLTTSGPLFCSCALSCTGAWFRLIALVLLGRRSILSGVCSREGYGEIRGVGLRLSRRIEERKPTSGDVTYLEAVGLFGLFTSGFSFVFSLGLSCLLGLSKRKCGESKAECTCKMLFDFGGVTSA